jgi:hypothetical protein
MTAARRVFFSCWLAYLVFWTPFIVREHFPALSLIERSSLNVERYRGWTDDIFSGPQGGSFINNNPGASLTAAVPLLLLKPVLVRLDQWNQSLPRGTVPPNDGELFWRTLAEGRAFYFLAVAFVTVALVMAPATAATAGYLCARLARSGVPAVSAARAALLYGLATPLLFRIGHLNHNLLAGDAGFLALLLLWDPQDRRVPARRAAAAGLLSGYAVLCDYSGVVVMAVAALYVWLRATGRPFAGKCRTLVAYAAGASPGLLALAAYQAWAFGSFYHPSQHYMVPTAPTSHGYRGFDWPSPALLWANFFDPRFGIFAYCPVLLLAFAAPFARAIRYRIPPRETRVLYIFIALFVMFCAANQYSWLQPSTGFRYLAPVVPPLALLALQAAQALPRFWGRVLAGVALTQSLILANAHENDVRQSLATMWHERGAFLWMIRLRQAGLAPIWEDAAVGAALLLLMASAWLALRTPSGERSRRLLSKARP